MINNTNTGSMKYQNILFKKISNPKSLSTVSEVKIYPLISDQMKARLDEYTRESINIWNSAMKKIKLFEDKSGIPFKLINEKKNYALDGVIVADLLHIKPQLRKPALEIFVIYYLAVHLFDDLVEDPKKFYSKFK